MVRIQNMNDLFEEQTDMLHQDIKEMEIQAAANIQKYERYRQS
jgi:hypothetical protein